MKSVFHFQGAFIEANKTNLRKGESPTLRLSILKKKKKKKCSEYLIPERLTSCLSRNMETISLLKSKFNYFKSQWSNGKTSTLAFENRKRMVSLKTRFSHYYTDSGLIVTITRKLNLLQVYALACAVNVISYMR